MNALNTLANDNSGIRYEVTGAIGHLILAQHKTLNALTIDMVDALHAGLRHYEADASIKLIIIRSDSERAFCAGGDMKRIRQHCLDQQYDAIAHYFKNEYALNLAIARCSKPFLALINGVAMGGGLGISVHGRFRVVTERALMAMPESRIGFFPDVGGSYFLPRLPKRCGYWLGLTSASVKGLQTVQTGLATHLVPSDQHNTLLESLESTLQNPSNSAASTEQLVLQCLTQLQETPISPPPFEDVLKHRAEWFSDDNLSAIRTRLQAAATASEDAAQLLDLLDSASPYSLVSTLELFRQAQGDDLASCLQREYEAAQVACRQPDLVEGVRAVLVDKDRAPRWA